MHGILDFEHQHQQQSKWTNKAQKRKGVKCRNAPMILLQTRKCYFLSTSLSKKTKKWKWNEQNKEQKKKYGRRIISIIHLSTIIRHSKWSTRMDNHRHEYLNVSVCPCRIDILLFSVFLILQRRRPTTNIEKKKKEIEIWIRNVWHFVYILFLNKR